MVQDLINQVKISKGQTNQGQTKQDQMALEIKEILTTRPGLSNHKAQDQINLNKTGKTDLQIRTRGLILIRDRIRIKGPIRIKVRMLQIQIILRQLPENPSLEISQGILIRIETGTATGTGIGIDQIKVRKVQEIHQKTPKF